LDFTVFFVNDKGRGTFWYEIGPIRKRNQINTKLTAIEGLSTSSHSYKFQPDRPNCCFTMMRSQNPIFIIEGEDQMRLLFPKKSLNFLLIYIPFDVELNSEQNSIICLSVKLLKKYKKIPNIVILTSFSVSGTVL